MKVLPLASTVLLAVSLSSAAHAADDSSAPAEGINIPLTTLTSDRARALFFPPVMKLLQEAQAVEKAGRMQEAIDKYQDAYDLSPLGDVQTELAFAQARAGLFLPAARHLHEILQMGSVRLRTVHTLEEVREVFAQVRQHVGTIALSVNVPDTRITIDGEFVSEWPYSEEVYVEPGMHAVKGMRDGYWMNQSFISLKAGERKTLSIAMQHRVHSQIIGLEKPITMNINMRGYEKDPKGDKVTWPKSLMIASSVGLALGLGGLVTGLVLSRDEEAQNSGVWTGVAVGGGIIGALSVGGLGIGIASRPDPTAPAVYITPQIARDGGGVSVAGSMP